MHRECSSTSGQVSIMSSIILFCFAIALEMMFCSHISSEHIRNVSVRAYVIHAFCVCVCGGGRGGGGGVLEGTCQKVNDVKSRTSLHTDTACWGPAAWDKVLRHCCLLRLHARVDIPVT